MARFLRAFLVLLKSTRLYDRDHPQVLQSLATVEAQLRAAQAAASRTLGLRVNEKSFISAGSARAVPDSRGELEGLAQDLARLGITTLAFPPDTHLGELVNFAAMLARKPALAPGKKSNAAGVDEVRRIALPADGPYTGDWAELLDTYRIEAIRINALLEEPKADATIASLVAVVLSEARNSAPQAEGPAQSVEELLGSLRLLAQLGGVLAAHATAAPQQTLLLLRNAVAAAGPRAAWIVEGAMARETLDAGEALDAYLERLTAAMVLEFVTVRFEARRLAGPDVRPLLQRLASEISAIGTVATPSGAPPLAPLVPAPWSEETWAEHLLERFWSELHASEKHETLHSHEAWCVPVAAVRRYVEPAVGGTDSSLREARATLQDYSRCLLAKDSVARLATASGLGELFAPSSADGIGIAAKLWPDELPEELVERVVWALVDERAPEVAGLLSAVTASLAQLAFERGHFAVLERIFQGLACPESAAADRRAHLRELAGRLLQEQRWQALVNSSLENRHLDAALARILGRDPDRLIESLSTQLATGQLHAVPAMTRLMRAIGEPAFGALVSDLFDPRTQVASAAVKLLATTQPERLLAALPRALPGWDWNLQDLAVSELVAGTGTGPARLQACAKVFLDSVPLAHPLVVPMMLDQIGLAREKAAVPLLAEIASGQHERLKDVFVRIKAVEALGRIGPASPETSGEAADALRQILRERRGLTHAEPAGLRAAAEEALGLIENWPSSARARTAREALEKSAVSHARPRRYLRIPLEAPLPARIVGPPEASARVRSISLGGAFLESSRRLNVGEAFEVEIKMGLRRINGKAVVRNVGASGGGVEFVHMKQEDRERLRKLVSKLLRQ